AAHALWAEERATQEGSGMDAASSPSFGVLLRTYRRAAGLTQEALAEQAGVSARAIADLERGTNRAPRHDTLRLLVAALQLSAEAGAALLAAAGQRTGESPPARAAHRAPHTLPVPLTPFIGRG